MIRNNYNDLTNSVAFKLISGADFKNMLVEYASKIYRYNQFVLSDGISKSDFDNIYRLQSFKTSVVKSEALKVLSHKTILKIFNHI